MRIKKSIIDIADNLLGNQFCRFLTVGVFITITNIVLIFILYNLFNLGYWGSSAIGYTIVTFLSYYLNKKFTFEYNDGSPLVLFKFIMTIATCYVFAYMIAKPLTIFIVGRISNGMPMNMLEQIAILVGMAGSTILNYVGQKLFVFKQRENNETI